MDRTQWSTRVEKLLDLYTKALDKGGWSEVAEKIRKSPTGTYERLMALRFAEDLFDGEPFLGLATERVRRAHAMVNSASESDLDSLDFEIHHGEEVIRIWLLDLEVGREQLQSLSRATQPESVEQYHELLASVI